VIAEVQREAAVSERERFDELYRAYYGRVRAFALRRTGDEQLAADIAAETFLTAWRRREDLPAQPLPWLLAAARKILANAYRAERRRFALQAKLMADAPAQAGLARHDNGADAPVVAAFNALPRSDREALALVVWDELAPHEAAAVIGIPTRRFSVRLHRAKRRLRKELQRSGYTPSAASDPGVSVEPSPVMAEVVP